MQEVVEKAGGVLFCAGRLRKSETLHKNYWAVGWSRIKRAQKVKKLRPFTLKKVAKIVKELYLSLVVDRVHQCLSFVASESGGVDIEKVSETAPEKILPFKSIPHLASSPIMVAKLIFGLGLQDKAAQQWASLLKVFIAVLSSKMPVLLKSTPWLSPRQEI